MLEGFGITQVMKEVAYADDDLILTSSLKEHMLLVELRGEL
tara:strand:+ start:370 stop:492 length:123 start_codon:yes stop_codon:yes gene_type:complete